MLDHQRQWWELQNFIKLLVGGYGCGKTFIGAIRCLYLSYLNKGLPGMYVSPTYKLAKRTIIPSIKEIAHKAQLTIKHNKTDNEFYIEDWDGFFWYGSGDDADSLRGPNLAWSGIDEPFIQSIDVLEQMLARIRVGEHRELFLTGTPEQLNWGYSIACNDDNRYDVGVVKGKTKDNTHLTPEYYETLKKAYSDEMQAAYLDGEFVNLNVGRAYKPFTRERHIKHLDIQNLEICAGLDFNVDYMSALVFAKGNGWVHFIDEIRISNSNSFELADKLKAKYPRITVYPDATGAARKSSSTQSDHSIFRDAGFHVMAKRQNPRVMDRINAVNKMLLNDYMTIEPNSCPWFIKDLERVVFKSGDIDKTSDQALTHASDAAGYPMAYLYPVRKRSVSSTIRN